MAVEEDDGHVGRRRTNRARRERKGTPQGATSSRGAGGGSGSTRRAGNGTTSRPTTGAAEALDAYLAAAGLEDGRAALFQSVDRVGGRLTGGGR